MNRVVDPRFSSARPLPLVLRLALLPALLLGTGCGRGPLPAPSPPALVGQRIMLLPVLAGDPEALDAELGFWLAERSPAVEWVLPDELQRTLDRAPAWRVRLNALPRDVAGAGRGTSRILDPTYGELRRLGAVVDAGLALMPTRVRRVERPEGGMELELGVALVDIRGGDVVWMRTVRAAAADGSEHGAAAAVAELLARTLFPER